MTDTTHPSLWTKDFILVSISNLLLAFSFYMLMPVLPFYLLEELDTSGSVAGIVLSLYTIAALLIRPFSGYMVDAFSRKPLYLFCYGIFCAVFAGYAVAGTLTLFIILRILHGFSFGLSTVSSNTVAVDIMPSQRRGEGIGYFGMTTNIAMAIGPAAGLWVYEQYDFNTLFLSAFAISFVGFICVILLKPIKKHISEEKQPLSFDRFILVKALPCVALLFIGGIGYGSVVNYIGLYSEQAAFESSAGIFFMVIAIGIVLARLVSARMINRGRISQMIIAGSIVVAAAYFLFIFIGNAWMLYLTAFLLGSGFGCITPAFQTMFINMARHDQRGTANATFFTFWDFGIGLGTAVGGMLIEKLGFTWLYGICGVLLLLGLLYFVFVSAPYYERKKLI